jgi:hypothetical protein
MMKVTGTTPEVAIPQVAETDWVAFPGGELEGRLPRVLCGACREQLHRRASGNGGSIRPAVRHGGDAAPLCFACYRAELARDRALKAAGELDTATEARFQSVLPLEPIDHARLIRLRAARAAARAADAVGRDAGLLRYVDKRRHAQIAARHALEQIGTALRMRNLTPPIGPTSRRNPHITASSASFARAGEEARHGHADVDWPGFHAAKLQFPEAWLPFVTAR